MEHRLKTIQPYFDDVKNGIKKFELRKNDRNYEVGDTLILEEWLDTGNVLTSYYSGQVIRKNVIYVLKNRPQFGLQTDYCILGFED